MTMTQTASGLSYQDTQAGTGASPQHGQTCVMHYTGWLWVEGKKGAKFDSSVDRGRPFEFPIGLPRSTELSNFAPFFPSTHSQPV